MKEKMRLLVAILLTLLCVFVLFLATYAWRATNRDTQSGGVGMDIDAEGVTIVDGDVYRYNMETLSVDRLSLNEETRLNEYDSIFLEAETNKKAAVYFVLHMERIRQTSFTVIVSCLDSSRDWSAVAMNTSDILKVNCALAETIDPSSFQVQGADPDAVFTNLNAYFTSQAVASTAKTFVDEEYDSQTGTHNKVTELFFPVTLSAIPDDDNADIVLMFDYDPALVALQDPNAVFGTGAMISLGEAIAFNSDIRRIRFEF